MATELITGSRLQACIWKEATWGTEAVGTAYTLPVSVANVTVGETQAFIDSQVARGGRKEQVPYPGLITSDGNSFTVIGHFFSIIHLLKHVLGDTVTTTGAGPTYTHTLKSLTDLPDGFGLEVALVDPATAANSRVYRAYGCRVSSLTIPLCKPAGECDVQVQFVAKKVEKLTTTPTAGTAYTETPIVYSDQTVLTINDGGGADAITDATEGSLTISLDTDYQHTCNNSGRYGMFGSGITRVRGTFRALLQSDSAYEALAEAGTYCQIISTVAPDASNSFQIDLPYCRIEKKPIAISGPMGIAIDVAFSAVEDTTDDTSPITITVVNTENGDDW